jgi:N-acyl-phosphatidylethanolamine-hydrolysing phospholipase D
LPISHGRYDHLDEPSVRALQAQAGGPPLFVAPLGVGAWLRRRGMTRVVALDGWQSHRDDALEAALALAVGQTLVLPQRAP